jgi:hypothetical protein
MGFNSFIRDLKLLVKGLIVLVRALIVLIWALIRGLIVLTGSK